MGTHYNYGWFARKFSQFYQLHNRHYIHKDIASPNTYTSKRNISTTSDKMTSLNRPTTTLKTAHNL